MQDSQFGFRYSWADLQPIRPLATTAFIVQIIGAVLGWWLAPFPVFNVNIIAGGFAASFPGFLIGLLIQLCVNPVALREQSVMVRRMGLISLLFSLLVFILAPQVAQGPMQAE